VFPSRPSWPVPWGQDDLTRHPDEQRARKLQSANRTRLGAAEEVAETSAALAKVTSEYQAGLAGDVVLWRALVSQLIEKKMYEARLKDAQARK